MLPQQILHYKIIEKIGSGGMGEVYLAEDTKLERKVILKFLSPNLYQDKIACERLTREAKVLSKLNHPNIAVIYGIEEYEDNIFISMEYIQGKTLEDYISDSIIPEDKLLDIAIEIAEGLKVAHDNNIIHRDIKPENIIITESGHVKILDFGLARLTGKGRISKEDHLIGTIDYMSPEQALGEEIDKQSDIFSFGVLLYECVSGNRPFKGDQDITVLHNIVHENHRPAKEVNPRVSKAISNILDNTLEKEKKKRYKSFDDILFNLKYVKKTGKLPPVVPEQYCADIKNLRQRLFLLFNHRFILIIILVLIWSFGCHQFSEYLTVAYRLNISIIRFLVTINILFLLSYGIVFLIKNRIYPSWLVKSETLFFVICFVITILYYGKYIINPLSNDSLRYALAESYNRYGIQCRNDDNLLEVKATFEKAISIESNNPKTWNYLGFINLETQSTFEAIFQFEKAIQIDSMYSEAWNNLGLAELQRGSLERAEQCFEKAIEYDSIFEIPYYNLADIYEKKNNYTGAIQLYQKAIDLNPNFTESYNNMGNLLIQMESYERAIEVIKQGLNINNSEPYLYKNLAKAFFFIDEIDSAYTTIHKAITLNNKFPEAYFVLAQIQRKRGEIEQSIESFEYFLSMNSKLELQSEAQQYITEMKRYNR